MTTAAAAAVIRNRTEAPLRCARMAGSATVAGQSVAGATDGLDRAALERFVDLATKTPNVDLDDVGVAFEVEVPDRFEQFAFGHDLVGVTYQELAARLGEHGLPDETEHSIKAKLKRGTFPATFFLDAQGRVVASFAGPLDSTTLDHYLALIAP